MSNPKWTRCQECGGEAGPRAGSDDEIQCSVCGDTSSLAAYGSLRSWDELQASTRARKRFRLVKASMMHMDTWGHACIISGAEDVLNELYGPVPKEESK